MSPRARIVLPVLLSVGVVVAGLALGPPGPGGAPGPGRSGGAGDNPGGPSLIATPTPRPPLGGTELYGYLPYWEMTEANARYLEEVPLTTLALFSVSARRTGLLNTDAPGYERITAPIGRQIIDDARGRDARVELVFSSFGTQRNAVFFGRVRRAQASGAPTPSAQPAAPTATASAHEPPWRRTVPQLVDLAIDLRVDGINVDVELLDDLDRPAYGEFLRALREELERRRPKATISVATEAGPRGVGNAATAHAAGVDRVFLMGYDYHWSTSSPGASSPVDRTDGVYDLRWSIDAYVGAGVARDRIVLGLPLYGMRWRTLGPDRTSLVVGAGQAWIPKRNLDVLLEPTFAPSRDPREVAEFFVVPDGAEWLVTYFDSPATLRAKLALARDQGLAGGGFWAVGYERGAPGYLQMMEDFRAGKVDRSEAPQP